MPAESRPKLALNLIQLLPNASGGIETYARELLPLLLDRLPDWEVTAFVNREGGSEYVSWDDRCEWRTLDLSWHDRFKRLHFESTVLPRILRRDNFDLLHNLVNTACRAPGCPQVTTIFDATPQLYPPPGESIPSKVFRKLLARATRRSDLILTISESAKRDLINAYDLPEDAISVILLAARERSELLPVDQVLSEFDLAADVEYFLTPAARRPNKNIEALLRAFAATSQSHTLLLLPGADAGDDVELSRLIEALGLTDRVKLLGWITDQQLDSLYAGALGMLFPSLAEGFGLPILEAMACACPVATSDLSSMPEVAGDNALFFDPRSISGITQAIDRLTDDRELRERLSTVGPARAAMFSWNRVADETVAAYRSMLLS
jgi:alpha-1,3-rhamnosyl/mannosyltransferase